MINVSIISLLSALLSVFAILLVLLIIKKVYQEEHRRPWIFIGVSAIFLAISELLRFLNSAFTIKIISQVTSEAIILIFVFISVAFLAYGLLLEYLIIRFYKGKFVKMKFVPVQEGTLGGELDLNISNGNSYLALKKDKQFILEQFSKATKSGYEGFLITEINPREVRTKYNISKTPICWINQIDVGLSNSQYLKESLDDNSDIIEPIQLNNLISFIDNFLEQSTSPFLAIDLNLILRVNNFQIVAEFLKYAVSRCERYNGILIALINVDILEGSQISDLKEIFKELE